MDYIYNIDIGILDWIQSTIKCSFLDFIMPIITSLGNSGMIWIVICSILLINKKQRKYGIILSLALILCFLVGNIFLKPLVGRIRPFDVNTTIELLIRKPLDFSFPSGHTMSSFAAATVLMYMNKRIGLISLFLATMIAFSRLYLYVHYPSDVLVGGIIGILLGILSIKIYLLLKKENNKE